MVVQFSREHLLADSITNAIHMGEQIVSLTILIAASPDQSIFTRLFELPANSMAARWLNLKFELFALLNTTPIRKKYSVQIEKAL